MAPGATSEFALHRAVYRARPDVNAVIHLHPQITVLLDSLGERIRLITTDHAVLRAPDRGDTVPSARLDAAWPTRWPRRWRTAPNCVILPHHGCAVLADSVDLALRRVLNLEEAARLTYRALLLTGTAVNRSIVDCPITFNDTSTI